MDTPFTPSPNDGAIELLRSIFGNVIDHVVDTAPQITNAATSNMLAEAFRYFNSGVLLFGTIVLMVITVMGVANTANDGEALGKKWSTFYTPLRTLVAASSLIPAASGYAGVQIAVFFVITYSIGFASNLWSSVVNYSVGQAVVEQAVQSIADDPNIELVAIDALRMHICAAGVTAAINATLGSSTPIDLKFQKDDLSPVTNRSYVSSSLFGNSLTYQSRLYFRDKNWAGSENICGQIVISSTFEEPNATSGSTKTVAQSLQGAIANIRYKFITDLFASNGFADAVSKAVATAAQTDDNTAVVDTQQISTKIMAMKQQFMASVSAEISKQIPNENAEVARKLSEKGWIYAGGLYMELARIKDAIRNATTTKSDYIAGSGTFDGLLVGDVAKAANGILRTFSTVSAEVARKTIEKQNAQATRSPKLPILQTNMTAADFTDGGNGIRMGITSWFNQYSISLLSGTVHYMGQPNQDPVMKVKNIGDWLSTAAITAMTAKAGITATLTGIKESSAAASNQPIVGAPASILTGVVAGISTFVQEVWSNQSISLFTILYVGYFLGIWIPMIPYYVFTLGVVGWLIFACEMLLASVLWMAAHITPAREESFIGSQVQGYMLIMSGFFRPALMIVGLVMSGALLEPIIQFINNGFILAVRTVQADSLTGIFSLAAFMLGYCFLIFSIFMLVFGLPQTIPDRILRWIGAGIGDMGEQSTVARLENSASTHARSAAVAAGTARASNVRRKSDVLKARVDGDLQRLDAASLASEPEGIAPQSTVTIPEKELD